MKKTHQTAPHYKWGEDCDGWRLVDQAELSVISERMPPLTEEVRHYHQYARQFFYVLKGTLTIAIEGQVTNLLEGEGYEVAPTILHQVQNRSNEHVHFLVTSQPSTKGDRVEG
ncbi:cupin domain-containing protein [Shouchella sp. JSM 1781072]|uniref:cupin domain-containing protein n=1 Tax=Shouchella sp. JSM 1781072 TaxID=3344581 RepID=UPI0035C038D1